MFLANIDATISIQSEKINKDGVQYLNVKDFLVQFHIGHASIELSDLFNGDKELGKNNYHVYCKVFMNGHIEIYIDCWLKPRTLWVVRKIESDNLSFKMLIYCYQLRDQWKLCK